jgi:hypothetical protein
MKGIAPAAFIIVGGAISLFIAIWIISMVQSSVSLPTVSTYVTNQTTNFVANNTYYPFVTQANCVDDIPTAAVCGVQPNGVVSVQNTSIVLGSGNYTYNTTHIKIMLQGVSGLGNYMVTYTYWDYSSVTPYNTLTSVNSIANNTFVLLAVGLIVIAATIIISYFAVGKRR